MRREIFSQVTAEDIARVYREALSSGYGIGNYNSHGNSTYSSEYQSGQYCVCDAWGGGQPSTGKTDIFYDGKLVWSMVYRDHINLEHKKAVKSFLKETLSLPLSVDDLPIRGPSYCGDGNHRYTCDSEGSFDIGEFVVRDKIVDLNGNVLYSGVCIGGWTNVE
jgi:hypothetical protein